MPISYGGDNITFPDASTQNTSPKTGFVNRIINGSCAVAQRGALSITGNSTPAIYGGCDRITGLTYGFSTATGTLQQSGSGFSVSGFSQAIVGLTTTGSGGVTFGQRIEALNIYDCNSSTVTVQAKVFQNTGSSQTHYLRLNKANSLNNFSGVTILGTSAAVTIPSGVLTTVTATFTLGSTDASNGILAEAFYTGIGAITSKDFHIADFQLEKGSTATPFEFRSIGQELALCQRYFQTYLGPPLRGVMVASVNAGRCAMPLSVVMRATPTAAIVSALQIFDGTSTGTITSAGTSYSNAAVAEFDFVLATGSLVSGRPAILYQGTGQMTFSAEL